MTIADELRKEGEIRGEVRGEIKMCRELMDKGIIPRELAEQKIAELSKRLEGMTDPFQMVTVSGSDVPDQVSR